MITLMLLQAAAAATAAPVASPPAPVPPYTVVTRTTAAGTGTSASVTAHDGASRMAVRCDGGVQVVSVQLIAKQALSTAAADGSFPAKTVTVRFDGNPAMEFDWEARSNAVLVSDPVTVTALTAALVNAKVVKISLNNASNFGFEGVYDGPATAAPITQVLAACGYTLGVVPPPLPAPKK